MFQSAEPLGPDRPFSLPVHPVPAQNTASRERERETRSLDWSPPGRLCGALGSVSCEDFVIGWAVVGWEARQVSYWCRRS